MIITVCVFYSYSLILFFVYSYKTRDIRRYELLDNVTEQSEAIHINDGHPDHLAV